LKSKIIALAANVPLLVERAVSVPGTGPASNSEAKKGVRLIGGMANTLPGVTLADAVAEPAFTAKSNAEALSVGVHLGLTTPGGATKTKSTVRPTRVPRVGSNGLRVLGESVID